jgi:fimbrial chaperone protein
MNLKYQNLRLVATALFIGCSVHGSASNFNVKPLRIGFSKAKMNSVVQIANLDDTTLTVQASVVRWSSDGEKSIYTPVDDILLNPPVFEIPAHSTQYMRLGMRKIQGGIVEQAYRLVLAEVPKPPEPGFMGLRTVVRISIPVFIPSETPSSALISWEAKRAAGVLKLSVVNSGTAHVQIKHLEVHGDQHQEPVSESLSEYLLPGQKHEWTIDDPRLRDAREIDLTAKTDDEDSHVHLVVEAP